MAIPENQLSTWSHQGATTTASATYESVRNALAAAASLRGRNTEVYLQGSYKNDTNVRGDSDVDVIAQINDVYYRDITQLDLAQQQQYESSTSPATYSWTQFREDVLATLRARYGWAAVHERNKCITIDGGSGRLKADVVVAAEFRRYRRYVAAWDESHHSGITFWTQRDHRQIENWPKQHHANGVEKNRANRAGGRYKAAVRMFKNARSAAVERGYLAEAVAPSYFVECLIYNVDDSCFLPSCTGTYAAVLNWLSGRDISRFVTGSELVWLFGPTEEQWSVVEAQHTINALFALWNTW
jgi:hypothetical protein